MKKWFAPVTFVQKKDTQEKQATASGYMLVCKRGNAKILPAKLWVIQYRSQMGWLLQVLHVLNKGIAE